MARDDQFTVRLNAYLSKQVTELAIRTGMDQADTLRTLISEGLMFRAVVESKSERIKLWQEVKPSMFAPTSEDL